MKRWLRTILKIAGAGAIVLRALLCAASLGLWVRSYFVEDFIARVTSADTPVDSGYLASSRGSIVFARTLVFDTDLPKHWVYDQVSPANGMRALIAQLGVRSGLGFMWFYENVSGVSTSVVGAPWWLVSLLFGVAPVRRLIRQKKLGRELCQHCGYDLRATPERCPECGAAATAMQTPR